MAIVGTGFTHKGQLESGTLLALLSGGHSIGIGEGGTQLKGADILHGKRRWQGQPDPILGGWARKQVFPLQQIPPSPNQELTLPELPASAV